MDIIGDGESDGYLDDDLDALISEDFLELQQGAIRSTQQQRQHPDDQHIHSLPSSASVPLRPRTLHAVGNTSVQPQAESFTDHPSSDYGDLDDEVLDAGLIDSPKNLRAGNQTKNVVPGVAGVNTQRVQWGQQGFYVPRQLQANSSRPPSPQVKPGPSIAHQVGNHGKSFEVEDDMFDNGFVEQAPAAYIGGHGSELKALEAKVAEVRLKLFAAYDDLLLIMPS